ncbi:MAG: fibronectin type III domain-containing protein, partial [Acidimicrobiales bacterium]
MRSEPAQVDEGRRRVGRRAGLRAAATVAAASLLVVAGLGAMIAAPDVAGAVNNNPTGNPTSPSVSYEIDCTNSQAGNQVAPLVTELDANTTVDTAQPTGATFGLSGTASTVLSGPFVANLESGGVGTTPLTLSWTETIGSTDGNATGSYDYTTPTISVANAGSTVKATWTSGSTTITGNFKSVASVGETVASGGTGFPSDATITAINGTTSITISKATTGAEATKTVVGFAAALTFTTPTFNTGDVFTTAGAGGETAGVGVTGVTDFHLGSALPVVFGGATGDGPANCLETGYAGYTVGSPAGPPQTGGSSTPYETAPALAVDSTTALVSVSPLQFPAAAYVNLLGGPPGAPTDVVATVGDTSAGLTWDAPASTGGSTITGYVITPYIGATAQTPVDVGDVLTDDVTGLANGTTYTFTVAATNSAGTGAASTASNAVTPATVPGTPTDVVATAGNASAGLTWDAPASDGGSSVTGYVITPYVGAAAQTPVDVGDVLTDDVTGLTNGTTYTFTVAATNAVGSGMASTASDAVTPITTPGAPADVMATAGDTSASLTWDAPASDGGLTITGYTITPYIGATAQTPVDVGDVLTDDVTGLTDGTTYTFTVAATNSAGTGAASTASNPVTPATVPGTPTDVVATAGNASASLTWDAPTSDGGLAITGYTITPYIGATAQTPVVVGDVTSDTVNGLTNGATYTFTVTASNAVGSGTASTASNAVTPIDIIFPPGAPTDVVATAGNASASLTWDAPASDGGSSVTGYVITPYIGATAQTPIDVGDVLTDDVTGLANGTTYTFTVAAINSAGTGAASTASDAVTPATVPGTPTDVVATAGDT